MGDRHDYVALEWVKGEIAETLKQARQALEAFVESPQDSTRMRFCMTYVHQVHGTLQMVEFYGAALLAEEMEQLARALLDERVASQAEALEVLMQAILQMPVYLDRIQSARRDLPMVVLPLLNDLRAARGEKLLSETSLFSPNMSSRTPALSGEFLAQRQTEDLPGLLRKLRQMLQVALVGVIRNQDLATNLGYMARVFARLEMLCKDAPLGALWQIASGLVEGLASGAVANGTTVKNLLRQVDKELKRLVAQGAEGINQAAPDELTKNLLFYVAKAPTQTPRIQALKAEYSLDEALPDSTVVDEERAQLAGPDRGAMRSVVAALCEELVRVKDSLDLFVRSDRMGFAELASLQPPLKQIADTLAVLGFGQPRRIILDQITVVETLANGQQQPDDAALMDVAGALLYVEATLAGMVGGTSEDRGEESHLPTTDVAQIHRLVIREARTGLEQAKDAIIEFIASQWNHQHLARVPELLTQSRGGLAMVPLARAAGLLDACNRYIQEQLLAKQAIPDWQSLDTLADAITSVEYYLERLSEDCGSQGDLILDVAEESLQALGYPLNAQSESAQPETGADTSLADADFLSDPLDEIEVLLPEPEPELEPGSGPSAAPEQNSEQHEAALGYHTDTLAAEQVSAWESEQQAESAERQTEFESAAEWPAEVIELSEAEPTQLSGGEAEDSSVFSSEELPADEPLTYAVEWSEAEMAELDMPEVSLPEPMEQPVASQPAMTLQDVMAAPVVSINPPARDVPPSILPPPDDEEPVDDDLLEVFIEEAAEVLETIGEYLPKWCEDTSDKATLGEIRRAFHTLKGSGRMVRALVIGELAWSVENLLNRVLDRSIEPGVSVKKLVNDVVALMPALVEEFAAKAQRQRDDVDRLAANAHALAKGLPTDPDPQGGGVELEKPTQQEPMQEMMDPQLLEIFRNEAESHLSALVDFLADCAQRLPQPVTDSLQRALHTLKGSAHMAGILPMAEIATPLEKMVKEFKANLIQMDLAEAELLHVAEQLLRKGLENLEREPLATIEGAEELIAQVHALHSARLADAGERGESELGEPRDPGMISLFLSEGMSILLDAEDLLHSWREHPAERQELSALLEELTTLGLGAQMADLPQIDALCQVLLKLYAVVQEGRLAVSGRFFDDVEQGHEALVGMMDQVAAGLQVTGQPELVERLEELLAEALDPQSFELPVDVDQPEMTSIAPVEVVETIAEAEAEAEAWAPEPALEQAQLDDLDEEMVEIFLDEAVDLLESAGAALDRWLSDPANQLALSALLRDLHTLKGGARMAEIRPIGDLSHELETLYEGLSDGRYTHSDELATLLLRSHDQLAVQLEQLQAHRPMDAATKLIALIKGYRQGVTPSFESNADELDEATQNHDDVPSALSVSDAGASMDSEQLTDELSASLETERVSATDSETLIETDDHPLDEVEPSEASPVTLDISDQDAEQAGDDAANLDQTNQSYPDEPSAMADPAQGEAGGWDNRDPELVEIFLEEGFDIMERASASLQRWVDDVNNSFEIEALQRDLHTLKGGARMADIREIGDLAHELEYLYEGLCAGSYRASPMLFTLLQTCHDRLAAMLDAVRAYRELPDGEDLIATIRHFRANPDEQLSMPNSVALKAAQDAAQDSAEAEILDIFVEEADDLLEDMEAALGRWEATRDGAGPLVDMMRVLHTLKGGARLAAQVRLGDMAHDLEQRLGEAQLQDVGWTDSLFLDVQGGYDALLKEVELMRSRLASEPESAPSEQAQSEPAQEKRGEPSVIQLETPIVAASVQSPTANTPAKVLPFIRRAEEAALDAASRRAPQELVKVPADLLEGLVNLAGETSIFRGRVEQQVSDVGFTLGEMEATIERVRDQLRRLDTETQAQILSRYQAEAERAGYDDFDPLEMDRHSQLQQLSRALFESASDLLDLKETLAARNRDAETLLLQQARVNTELQEGLMRTRMVPFDRLVPRLRRIVRQVAGELGKQVEFHVGNATGEMDRSVLERIVAPLEHMLRNAVDHGIESMAARVAAGKPEQGNIRLELSREGGDIVLALSDDGAGINLEAVRRKAVERGLMLPGSDLSDHEVLQFILEAGFSTAEKVTQISGRGVGMDVVHSEVKQLGGSMSIESTLGSGTRFLIRLPFTVSVNRALMVYSGEDLYAIPLNTIEGIVRVSPYELEAYYQPGASRFEYAGQTYELRYLGELLNNGQRPKLVGQSLPLPVILVRSNEHSVAVQVDSLAGSREIVVKSLGPQFATVPGISGATILGDGRVVVILDLLATIRVLHAHLLTQQQPLRLLGQEEPVEVEVDRPTLVMVVDDSVTVRKVTSRLLERNGMNVLTAKDGVDAITQLQERKPDVMLLDIEMPRMDGFEVATLVRHDEHLKDLPIIMITSRTGEKHRDRAMAIGVNEYLGKPYQESLLLETIQKLVKHHE
ncbi:Hpt domain-containing protein [Stutzerimonas stutzeri]|uniref:Hpt domain-containing protein n=1 Tax=Stutzerimonas stutzeri TaxID=316 RepID=UPI00210EFB3B|nr:Hpt domain-containing protein [Stutzerimonas stutzeri]MCQ4256856.1 Hpt domain-containing protein [Stutzerimonas stutzeri]